MDLKLWREHKTVFGGDEVTVMIRPLKRKAMQLLLPKIQKSKAQAEERAGQSEEEKAALEDENFVAEMMDVYEAQELAVDIFPDHVKDIQGLRVEGEPATVEDLTDLSMLSLLTADIITALISISQITQADVKKSSPPSDQTEEEIQKSQESPQASG